MLLTLANKPFKWLFEMFLDHFFHLACFCRNYMESGWCMEEFKMAHLEMIKGQKKYLVPILKEEIDIDSLPSDQRDLQMYLRTYTYIDGTEQAKNLER